MQTKDLIQVLWVENDPTVVEAYPYEAEDYDLHLVPFLCFDDAYKALQDDYNRWDAIILDAKCKVKETDIDKAVPFLTQSISRIAELAKEYNKTINWYILSGQGEEHISDAIPDTRLAWDKDWTDSTHKKFYSKETDRKMLFMRIRAHYRYKAEFQIKNDLYKPVFTAIKDADLDVDVCNIMEDLLTPIHFNVIDTNYYNKMYADARRVIEWIFRSMIKNGILPPSILRRNKGKEQINLTWASKFLAGEPDPKSNLEIVDCNVIFPKVVSEIVKNILYISGSKGHTTEISKEDDLNISEYLYFVGNTPYLLRAASFQLCDVIIWYAKYLKEHPDSTDNCKKWIDNNI